MGPAVRTGQAALPQRPLQSVALTGKRDGPAAWAVIKEDRPRLGQEAFGQSCWPQDLPFGGLPRILHPQAAPVTRSGKNMVYWAEPILPAQTTRPGGMRPRRSR
jgi:hypothetical protein